MEETNSVIETDDYPEAVSKQKEEVRIAGGSFVYSCSETKKQYVYIALGERPTGGYSIKVSVEETKEKIIVKYQELKPDKDDIVTQAITYPDKMLVFERGKDVEIINKNNKE
ncbi:protease complex subunit PrcB family protein [Proteinivorax tanatarense]|uniref:Protease complex subunit PrcB family protein n=1 Tax=Proteinivorax tanatarense TaxID=1260629 RepID=A0AAU7VN86_9FIRM